jgi:hypothetical protein
LLVVAEASVYVWIAASVLQTLIFALILRKLMEWDQYQCYRALKDHFGYVAEYFSWVAVVAAGLEVSESRNHSTGR